MTKNTQMSDLDRHRYSFFKLLTGAAEYERQAAFAFNDEDEAVDLRQRALLNRDSLLYELGKASESLGANAARSLLKDEALVLSEIYAQLYEHACELADREVQT